MGSHSSFGFPSFLGLIGGRRAHKASKYMKKQKQGEGQEAPMVLYSLLFTGLF
jgi:hypothetical protein